MPDITIAIDGGAGVGKGTTAEGVAKALGYRYLDTGALYRAVTLYALRQGVDMNDPQAIKELFPEISLDFRYNPERGSTTTILNGEDVDKEIRSQKVSDRVAKIASYQEVRTFLLDIQKELAAGGGIVIDGRDIGTVICPQAELKVFMSAELDIRAKRRQRQLAEQGEDVPLEDIKQNLRERDEHDFFGENPTSFIAPDARRLDTSHITIDEQVQTVVDRAKEIINNQ